jgi:hypothetical protein
LERRVIFGLAGDRSRIFFYLEAGFGDVLYRFLSVLCSAIARQDIVRAGCTLTLVDDGFTGRIPCMLKNQ